MEKAKWEINKYRETEQKTETEKGNKSKNKTLSKKINRGRTEENIKR